MKSESRQSVASKFRTQTAILGWALAIFWALELVDTFLLHQSLNLYGIRPRSRKGLIGILVAPLLHGGLPHLIANTLPFFVLAWLVMIPRPRDFFGATAIITLVSGLGIWTFGASNTIHIGASGLVFGYLGFLLFRGLFEQSVRSVLIALVVGIAYGGLIWGVLPSRPGISWEAHLFGFISGALAARLLARRPQSQE